MDYGYTTLAIQPEYRNLTNSVADYHGLTTSQFLPLLITAYSFMSPEGREAILDIGAKLVAHLNSGMPMVFNDSLEVSETCLEDIQNVQNPKETDKDNTV